MILKHITFPNYCVAVVPIVPSEWKVPAFEGLLLFPGSFPEESNPSPSPNEASKKEDSSPSNETKTAAAAGTTSADGGDKQTGGRVYGRGAQDMKCVCAMYIAAVARLKAKGNKRSITHILIRHGELILLTWHLSHQQSVRSSAPLPPLNMRESNIIHC